MGRGVPNQLSTQSGGSVDVHVQRTDLQKLGIKLRALERRVKDPRVPSEERARAQRRLDLTRQEIDSLRRCAQMP